MVVDDISEINREIKLVKNIAIVMNADRFRLFLLIFLINTLKNIIKIEIITVIVNGLKLGPKTTYFGHKNNNAVRIIKICLLSVVSVGDRRGMGL